jgi:hypothetical protein
MRSIKMTRDKKKDRKGKIQMFLQQFRHRRRYRELITTGVEVEEKQAVVMVLSIPNTCPPVQSSPVPSLDADAK